MQQAKSSTVKRLFKVHKFSEGHKKELQASICSQNDLQLHFQNMNNLKRLNLSLYINNINSFIKKKKNQY